VDRSLSPAVSNQSADSSNPFSRAAFAMPGYMSVYSSGLAGNCRLEIERLAPIVVPVAGSPTAREIVEVAVRVARSPSAVERNVRRRFVLTSTSALFAK